MSLLQDRGAAGLLAYRVEGRCAGDFDMPYYLLEGPGLTGFCGTS